MVLLALALLAVSVWPARQLGTEFMPNLNEGALLYTRLLSAMKRKRTFAEPEGMSRSCQKPTLRE